jgi:hypothetical protein
MAGLESAAFTLLGGPRRPVVAPRPRFFFVYGVSPLATTAAGHPPRRRVVVERRGDHPADPHRIGLQNRRHPVQRVAVTVLQTPASQQAALVNTPAPLINKGLAEPVIALAGSGADASSPRLGRGCLRPAGSRKGHTASCLTATRSTQGRRYPPLGSLWTPRLLPDDRPLPWPTDWHRKQAPTPWPATPRKRTASQTGLRPETGA